MKIAQALVLTTLLGASCSCSSQRDESPSAEAGPQTAIEETMDTNDSEPRSADAAAEDTTPAPVSEVATLGAGCFWCIEAVLEQIEGVTDVSSGYMGGEVENPSYRAVCAGTTGHAEVVQVTFDPRVLPYEELLDWFWRLHDPTTLNRQDRDIGTQYRSAIYVHSAHQRATAEASKAAAQEAFPRPIVTEITDASTYYVAEGYHQDYYRGNKAQGYCQVVIKPKLKKLGLQD